MAKQKPKKIIEAMVGVFVDDLDDDIDSQVRDLSLEDYGTWLKEFKEVITALVNSRLEAQREDMKR